MRYQFLLFATALIAPQIMLAQSRRTAACDIKSCKTTFTFGAAGISNAAKAAYSGVQTRELLEQLPDGTDRTTPAFPPSIIYRDSQARIRIEYSIPPSRRVRPPFDNPWVEIQDPLAGYLYVLDPVHHIAHRVTLHRPEAVTRPAFVYAAPDANAPGDTVYLGTKFMFGVTLTGRKTTSVSRMRNGESTTNVVEIWTDPQTNVEVLRKMIGSHGGYTKTIQNYSNAEPDSALFLVPASYHR